MSPFKPKNSHALHPIRYKRSGVVVHDPEKIARGVTLISSGWKDIDWFNGIRLFNQEGRMLHRWDIDARKIYPTSPHDDRASGTKNHSWNYIHGSHLLPDGRLLFNIEYLGLAMLDSCGEVLWKLPYRTHHSVSMNEDGHFWVSGQKWLEENDSRRRKFRGLQTPLVDETVILVSQHGELLKEISILDSIYGAGLQTLFWQRRIRSGDVTHLNDVEELGSEFADSFELFETGDLVVSLKHLHLVFVMDQNGAIKWHNDRDQIFQHDPDFEPDGRLTIFDNRADGTVDGSYLGGSRIIAIHPDSDVTEVIYPRGADQFFYTSTAGKHQILDNGNRLITESIAGRVFEIDADGNTVWEWIQEPYDDKQVSEVLEGSRYKLSEEQVANWECSPARALP